jgi:predicted MPP superfamily phosphohydrolase
MLIGGGLFGSLIYGFGNKYRYQLRRMQLAFEKLPASFKGLKVVHISDIHSGSFTDKHAVKKGVEKILKEKPDLILFTGDLVNNRSDEMDDFIDIFKEVKRRWVFIQFWEITIMVTIQNGIPRMKRSQTLTG